MPSVRIKDNQPNNRNRRETLYELFGDKDLTVTGLIDGNNCYYAKTHEEVLDRFLSEPIRKAFTDKGYEIVDPPEVNALRSVIIRSVDKQIENYTREQIKKNIEQTNPGLSIEEFLVLPNTNNMIKIRFQNQNMAYRVIEDGIKILNQFLPANSIEREVFIRLTPCYNCYGYEHPTRNCQEGNITVCNKCSGRNHRSDKCTSNFLKCLNCNQNHHTFANKCPTRKAKIKELSISERKKRRDRTRSRSRSQARTTPRARYEATAPYRPPSSYARAADPSQGPPQAPGAQAIPPESMTQNLISQTLSCMMFATIQNALNPGSFQEVIDEMYELNGLAKVKFPENIDTSGILLVTPQIIPQMKKGQQEPQTTSKGKQSTPPQQQPKPQRQSPATPGVLIIDEEEIYGATAMDTEEDMARKRNRSDEIEDSQETYQDDTAFHSPVKQPKHKQKKQEHETRFAPPIPPTPANSPANSPATSPVGRQRLTSQTQTTPMAHEMKELISKNVTILYPWYWYIENEPNSEEIINIAIREDDEDCLITTNDHTETRHIKHAMRKLEQRGQLLHYEITLKKASKKDFEYVIKEQTRHKLIYSKQNTTYAEQAKSQVGTKQSTRPKK